MTVSTILSCDFELSVLRRWRLNPHRSASAASNCGVQYGVIFAYGAQMVRQLVRAGAY